jgi:hypothetical protein
MRLPCSVLIIGSAGYFDRQLIAPQIHMVARWRLGRMMTLSGATKLLMSALGQTQTFAAHKSMSALPPKADMCSATRDVCFVPIADMRL